MRLLGQKIILRQMSVLCQIGIHAHELNKPQRVMVDVTLGLAASVRAEPLPSTRSKATGRTPLLRSLSS